jgi:hypothetical protein
MSLIARLRVAGVALAGIAAASCFNFHLVGPDEPEVPVGSGLVSVTIEYRQPPECLSTERCDEPVVFWGSWMVPGAEFSLAQDAGRHIWRGVALAGPANFPPHGEPYDVHVNDPYLRAGPSQGMTALRLTIGGESLRFQTAEDTPSAHGFIYIDSSGLGHNPF